MDLMVCRLIKGRPIQFKVREEPSLEFVETDPEKVHQILAHLLTNAVKFTEKGEISLEIRPRLENGNPFAEFSVLDTGIGVNQEDQDIIFEEFRQLDGTSKVGSRKINNLQTKLSDFCPTLLIPMPS